MPHASLKSAFVQEGDIVAGKYRVDRVLGAGGMGVVVAAHHIQLEERVALKFLLPEALANPEALARFVREARAAVKIKNEHVARVSDVGTLENGSPYIVMEYLEGEDLAQTLRRFGALRVEDATDFVLQACEALAEAHTLGIVHRDLKPANLFCVQKPDGNYSIKVLDFGISKLVTPGTAAHDMTKTTAVMGTPMYMSPEQLQQSKGVDSRTDVWSLGVILFELLTGRTPFAADALTELIIKIAVEPAPLLGSVLGEAPPELEAVLVRCLAKDRTQRYQTVGDLAIALSPFATPAGHISIDAVLGTLRKAGISTESSPPPRLSVTGGARASAMNVAPPTQTAASWGQTGSDPKPAGGGRAAAAIAIAATLGVLILGSILVLRKAPTSSAPGDDPPHAMAAGASPPSVDLPAMPGARVAPAAPVAPVAPAAPVASVAPVTPSATATTPTTPTTPSTESAPITRTGRTSKPATVTRPSGPAAASPDAPEAALSTPPAGKVNCDPPFYYDAKRARIFKPECL